MKCEELSRAARITLVSKVDLSPRGVYLEGDGKELIVTYRGVYASGTIRIPSATSIPKVVVKANQFGSVVPLFEGDDDLTLEVGEADLTLRTADKRATLRQVGSDSFQDPVAIPQAPAASTDRDQLAAEVSLASNFCATSPQVPILTGVRLQASKGRLLLSAFEGKLGLYLSVLEADVSQSFDLSIPPNDLGVALELIESGKVNLTPVVGMSGEISRFAISSDAAVVEASILQGTWPDVSAIVRRAPSIVIEVDSDKLASVTGAVKAFAADEIVVFEAGEDGKLRARTEETEAGAFSTVIGEATHAASFALDANLVRLACRLGPTVRIGMPSDLSYITLQSKTRRFWAHVRAAR